MLQPASFVGTDRFQMRSVLGEGATGRVYRVRDRETDRDVALKTLRLPSAEALYRLKQEFRARAGLVHPNLLQLHELFVEADSCFFTMEVIDGVDFLHWSRGGSEGRRAWGSTQGTLTQSLEGAPLASGTGPLPVQAAPSGTDAPPVLRGQEGMGSWDGVRRGLMQLLQALRALHAAGIVHRDIKPSNVLVTPEERVVVLDFGLASRVSAHEPGPSRPRRLVGTPAYMAPEQVTGEEVTPSADLYAVGALLYEVLTGAPPFVGMEGSPLEHKVLRAPPHVLERAPRVPEHLAQLAMSLLERDPQARPDLDACVALLAQGTAESFPPKPFRAGGGHFVGREAELARMECALDAVASAGRQTTLHLHGPSGIGKSTLVWHFLARSAASAPVVFQGRCHPEERIPYRALDASIDALARHLETLPAAEAAMLVPPHASALARLFPVLGRLGAFPVAPEDSALPDVAELRRQGARALRELLARLGRRGRPLVLWIDDAQWADSDSLPVLEELLRVPAPPLLWVLTSHGGDAGDPPPLRRLLELARTCEDFQELELGALPARDVAVLASSLLETSEESPQVRAVVAHAEGNPFIALELSRHGRALAAAAPEEGAPVPEVDVARLVVERVQALPAAERALLEVVSLTGRPLARGIALEAAGLDEGRRVLIATLRDSGLLREAPGGREEPELSAYHERIRVALLGGLTGESRARRHRAVAIALGARGSEDDEALLLHWEGAGEPVRAGHHAVRSADRAARALAFEHAAELYRKALELLGEAADRPALQERLAEALANLGRAAEAAHHYLEGARALGGALEAPRVRDLKRRASEQYLKSGRFDEGWRELWPVLHALGVKVPGSFLSAVWAATWRRLLFLLRPVDLDGLEASSGPSGERHRLDVLWSACTSWTMVNPMLADAFRMMHLLEARRLGDTTLLSRAMALEATMELHTGGRLMEASAARLLAQVRAQVERSGGPYDRAWFALARVNQGYTQGHWRQVVEEGERAEGLFREHCPGSDWERVTVAIFHHHALAMRGSLRELAERLEDFQREARLRGDLHACCEAYVGEPVVAWLARDQEGEARARAAEAMDAQSPVTPAWPQKAYRRQQFAHLIASVYGAHYRGDPWSAWRAVLEQWAPLKATFMLALRTTGLNLRHMRARAALAAAATLANAQDLPPDAGDAHWRKATLLADARTQARDMERDPLGCARPLSRLVRAGLAFQEGNAPEARTQLEQAVEEFTREGMALYREAARYALGALWGGPEGEDSLRRAREWMNAEGVIRPGALTAALVPGIPAWPEAWPQAQ